MSDLALFLVFVLVWFTIGVVSALVMGRRGHHASTWWVLGAGLGPFVIPVALQSVRREREANAKTLSEGVPGDGPIDVLVGVDGSREALHALETVTALLGPRIGRLTLACAIDHDTAGSDQSWDEGERAIAELERDAAQQHSKGRRCIERAPRLPARIEVRNRRIAPTEMEHLAGFAHLTDATRRRIVVQFAPNATAPIAKRVVLRLHFAQEDEAFLSLAAEQEIEIDASDVT